MFGVYATFVAPPAGVRYLVSGAWCGTMGKLAHNPVGIDGHSFATADTDCPVAITAPPKRPNQAIVALIINVSF